MLLTGVDIKGSHVNPNNSKVVEIALVLWDTVQKQPLKEYSSFIYEEGFEAIDPTAQEFSNFSSEVVKNFGERNMQKVAEKIFEFLNASGYIFGHNLTKMTKANLEGFISRHSDINAYNEIPKLWINSTTDIEFPLTCQNYNLLYLCGYHGVQNSFPRRSLSDLYSILKISSAYDFDRVCELAKSELLKIATTFSIPRYEDRTEENMNIYEYYKTEARKQGFKWSDSNKCWTKNVKKLLLDEGKIQYTFPTTILGYLY